MMLVYRLHLTLHDQVFHATRELGRNYQTGEYLHNYALSYALGLVTSTYHDAVQVPRYREDLLPVAEAGLYVTPARPARPDEWPNDGPRSSVGYATQTFKFADPRYHVDMVPSSVNVPSYGRTRELTAESSFVAFAICREAQTWPRWIRLGKWLGKAEVQVTPIVSAQKHGLFTASHVLNPLDTTLESTLYDLINMPPVSLIVNARFEGDYLELHDSDRPEQRTQLPADLAYRFP